MPYKSSGWRLFLRGCERLHGDGTRTATGWVKSDDAFLVFDRNGNGSIDSGRELFGDSTALYTGGTAADGFAALAQEDTNQDGLVDAADTNWSSLKVWRDLNQDGVSQSNELFTLQSQNIVALKVARTANSQTLANGNQIADLGGYLRSDGSEGALGEVVGMGDINLATNPFYREFADSLDTSAGATLPDMQGSGAVRDLREAASQSPALAASLAGLQTATSRDQFKAGIALILQQWADGASFTDSFESAVAANRDLFFVTPGVSALDAYNARYATTTAYTSLNGTLGSSPLSAADQARYAAIRAEQASIERLIKTLETFNGSPFAPIAGASSTLTAIAAGIPAGSGMTGTPIIYNLEQARLDLLQQSYQALERSVFDGLAPQTRLKPLLEMIGLTIDDNGVALDFSTLNAEIDQRIAADPVAGFGDLVDFNSATRDKLKGSAWQGWSRMVTLLETHAQQAGFKALLAGDGASGVTCSPIVPAARTRSAKPLAWARASSPPSPSTALQRLCRPHGARQSRSEHCPVLAHAPPVSDQLSPELKLPFA